MAAQKRFFNQSGVKWGELKWTTTRKKSINNNFNSILFVNSPPADDTAMIVKLCSLKRWTACLWIKHTYIYIIVGKKKCAEREKTNSWKLFFSVCEIESLAATWSVVHISYFHLCCAAIRCWHAIPTHPFRANFGTFIVHHHHHRHRHHNHEHTSVQTIIPSGLLFICLRARWHTNSIKIKCNRNINFDNRPTCIVWHNQRVDNVQTITPHHKTAKKNTQENHNENEICARIASI